MEEEEPEEECLGSIGFMFDAQHARCTKSVTFGDISLKLRMIGEDPGHVQSGQYLWPAASFLADYLISNWGDLRAESAVELGAGVGLAGIFISKLLGMKRVVLTDYDHGALQLIEENIILNTAKINEEETGRLDGLTAEQRSNCDIKAEFLQWGDVSSGRNVMKTCTGSGNGQDNSETETPFEIVIGTDLLYSKDIVQPLFKSVKQLLSRDRPDRLFILAASFNPGKDIEIEIDRCMKELSLSRQEMIALDEKNKICRIEYYRHLIV